MQEKNISAFCEAIMDKIKGKTREDVSLAVNAPKLNVKINPEQLERILLHLLENAAEYTPAGGKIWLDFKKRGAHTHQSSSATPVAVFPKSNAKTSSSPSPK